METTQAQAPITAGLAAANSPRVNRSPTRLILGLSMAVAVAGLAFAGGRLTAPAVASGTGTTSAGVTGAGRGPDGQGGAGGQGGPGAFGPGGAGGASVAGTVTGISATA